MWTISKRFCGEVEEVHEEALYKCSAFTFFTFGECSCLSDFLICHLVLP